VLRETTSRGLCGLVCPCTWVFITVCFWTQGVEFTEVQFERRSVQICPVEKKRQNFRECELKSPSPVSKASTPHNPGAEFAKELQCAAAVRRCAIAAALSPWPQTTAAKRVVKRQESRAKMCQRGKRWACTRTMRCTSAAALAWMM
jgi:hypothetical protein